MIGQYVKNYKITAHLGEGGMGTVFRATDDVLGRDVALKMLHAPLLKQPQFLDRFKKEARVLAQLLHPNIALIYNFIEQDENHFMVMEYVEGKNLESLLKQYKTLSHKTITAVFFQALEGLRHAHRKGILHRDIKPSNLNLTPDGTVKLMDFGIAIMVGEQRLTQANRIVGTVEFMAPELIQGKEPSIASDIYAIGVTMYELLTGKLPFESNTDYNLMQEILKKKPVSADKINASIPKALANIVMKALEKNPEQRYTDAKAFQQALLTAFPDVKDIDLSTVYTPIPIPATKVIQVSTKPEKNLPPTRLQGKQTDSTNKLFDSIARIRKNVLAEKKKTKIVLVSLLIFIVSAIIALFFKNTPAAIQPLSQNDTLATTGKKEVQYIHHIDSLSTAPVKEEPVTLPAIALIEENTNKKEEEELPTAKGKKTEPKKEIPVIEKIKEPKKEELRKEPPKEEIPVQPEIKKEEPKPEVAHTPKTIRLQNRLEVSLYLMQPINAATAEAGQTLQFSVTSPVRYDGETIIENGAIATGRIKNIGNKKMSILFINVTARNGQALPFADAELSGRIVDLLNNRNYSAHLKRGITINF